MRIQVIVREVREDGDIDRPMLRNASSERFTRELDGCGSAPFFVTRAHGREEPFEAGRNVDRHAIQKRSERGDRCHWPAALCEERRDHRRRRGLAVGPGDADGEHVTREVGRFLHRVEA